MEEDERAGKKSPCPTTSKPPVRLFYYSRLAGKSIEKKRINYIFALGLGTSDNDEKLLDKYEK
jgi:hypothetical protein